MYLAGPDPFSTVNTAGTSPIGLATSFLNELIASASDVSCFPLPLKNRFDPMVAKPLIDRGAERQPLQGSTPVTVAPMASASL